MKVLYHHRTQAEDGQAVHIRALQDAFRAEGHEVLEVGLVAQAGAREAGAELAAQRSRYRWIERVPRFARELAEYGYTAVAHRRLLAAARDFRPDLLYERYAFGNLGGATAAEALRKPLFLEVNSPMVLELSRTRGLSFPRFAARIETHLFRRATRLCAVTAVLRDLLVEIGAPAERVLVTPNGVDLELYPAERDPAAVRAARQTLGLEPEPQEPGPVLGFVGYYRDWHRLDLAVAALGEPGLERAELVLIGEGPARPALEAAAERHGVSRRVHFAGRHPHAAIPGLLAACDVALLPAINPYASPLKLHEYMAAHLPTVAPDQPNLREVLTDGVNARLVPPGDGEAFATAVVELCRDGELRRRLGAAARATILTRDLTWRGNARTVIRAACELRQP
jgi:glycosyltransferase involved in cell wall biosynthesis